MSGDEICFEVGICRFDQYPIDANANLQQLKMSVNVVQMELCKEVGSYCGDNAKFEGSP